MKKLTPVLVTPSRYLEMNILSEEEIARRNSRSEFISTGEYYCDYPSFVQTGIREERRYLSFLFAQTNAPSVFQLVTANLVFEVKWTLRKRNLALPSQTPTLYLLDVSAQRGYEPPDINGNKICLQPPVGSESTFGSFVLPGAYLFFFLADKSKNLEIKFVIDAYRDSRTRQWNSAEEVFLKKGCVKVLAYVNDVDHSASSIVVRKLNPCLLDYEAKVLQRYYSKVALPCFTPPTSVRVAAPDPVPLDFFITCDDDYQVYPAPLFVCRSGYYANPDLGFTARTWATVVVDERSQVHLTKGTYRLSNLTLSSQGAESDWTYFCPSEPNLIKWLFYSCNEQAPVTFTAVSPDGHDYVDQANMQISIPTTDKLVEFPPLGVYHNITLNIPASAWIDFEVLEDQNYAFRLNYPVWRGPGSVYKLVSNVPPGKPGTARIEKRA